MRSIKPAEADVDVAKDEEQAGSHGARMLGRVTKSATSQQLTSQTDLWNSLYQQDKAIEPPLPLDGLLDLLDANPIHSSCVQAKVADAVGRGWELVPDDPDEVDAKEKAGAEGDLRNQLEELCPPDMPFDRLVKQATKEMEATGWGAIEVGREGDDIAGLFPLPAQTLRATKDDDVFVQVKGDKKVYFKRFGVEEHVNAETGVKGVKGDSDEGEDANEVLVFRHYSERSQWYGRPPWLSGVPAIAEMTAIREFNVDWFTSGGRSDRIIHVTAADNAVAKTVADLVVEKMQEARGKGHTSVVTHGDDGTKIQVEEMTKREGQRDGQFVRRREDLVKEILIAHQVPPYRVGWADLGSLGGSAASEMLEAYRYGTIEDIQTTVETTLNATLFSDDNIVLTGWKFAFTDIAWDEQDLEWKKVEFAVEHGMMTPNDGREKLGLTRSTDPALDAYYYEGKLVSDATGASSATEVVDRLRQALAEALGQVTTEPEPDVEPDADPDLPVE